MPIYIGDDVSDEDAFLELSDGRGIPIVVRQKAPLKSETAAKFWLRNPYEVVQFLTLFLHDMELVPVHDNDSHPNVDEGCNHVKTKEHGKEDTSL